jgi:hypothetical protein
MAHEKSPAAVTLGKKRWEKVSKPDRRVAALKLVAQRRRKRRDKEVR